MHNTNGIRTGTVETASFSMDFFSFGKGKRILVILPGLSVQSVMGSANAVAQAYRQLTDDFTIYVFDRRKDLPASYAVSEMARDTAAAIQAAGLERVSIFGASQGGMIAMEIAITYPALVENLVLVSASARIPEAASKFFEKWIDLAKKKNARDLYLAFGEAIYPQSVFEQLRELLTEAAKTVTEEDLHRFVILAGRLKDIDMTHDLDRISCPVLVIGDKSDRIFGAEATETLEKHLRRTTGFESHMYDGYGHAAYDTAPDCKERILRFLQKGREN